MDSTFEWRVEFIGISLTWSDFFLDFTDLATTCCYLLLPTCCCYLPIVAAAAAAAAEERIESWSAAADIAIFFSFFFFSFSFSFQEGLIYGGVSHVHLSSLQDDPQTLQDDHVAIGETSLENPIPPFPSCPVLTPALFLSLTFFFTSVLHRFQPLGSTRSFYDQAGRIDEEVLGRAMADSKEVRSSFAVFSSIFANLDPPRSLCLGGTASEGT